MNKLKLTSLSFTAAILALLVGTSVPSLAGDPVKTGDTETPSSKLMPGFKPFQVKTSSGVMINGVVGGSGPPVLLLHGAPVNLAGWRKVAPGMAKNYTVVVTDLRGYGDSDMPEGGENHANYAKRVMAQDQVDVMTALGFKRFHVVGHDRGGRVAHRLAIDHKDKVITLTVMDIMPTLHLYENVDRKFAEAYWFWFFLTAPAPVPETMISDNPRFFMDAGMFDARKKVEDANPLFPALRSASNAVSRAARQKQIPAASSASGI
jgi:haloacetate dehalogenase